MKTILIVKWIIKIKLIGTVIDIFNINFRTTIILLCIMNKSKKETGNTETKDYEAKAEGKFPDDSLYPDSEQSKPVTKKDEVGAASSGNDEKKTKNKKVEKNIIPKVKGNKLNKTDHVPDYEPVKHKLR